MSGKFVPFWLDVNFYDGQVTSSTKWKQVVAAYAEAVHDSAVPLQAERGDDCDGVPFFSFDPSCQGETLAEWAAAQGMDLPVD